jgi:hypothetical protein
VDVVKFVENKIADFVKFEGDSRLLSFNQTNSVLKA